MKDHLARILSHTTPEPNTGCWLWTGSCLPSGYGTTNIGVRKAYAHRASLELHCGPIPGGAVVMHLCNQPSCVNPAHLRAGSQKQNLQQCIREGRFRRANQQGENNHSKPRLNDEKVRLIRQQLAAGETVRALCQEFGVGFSTITRIRSKTSWSHVA